MFFWALLFLTVILSSIAGIIYLVVKVNKFIFIKGTVSPEMGNIVPFLRAATNEFGQNMPQNGACRFGNDFSNRL